jgi:hypothetical protein
MAKQSLINKIMEGFTIEKKHRFEQETQKPFEVHKFFGFVILAQQSQQRPNENEVICIEISTINKLIEHLQEVKQSISN